MRDDERLNRGSVFLNQIGDARRAVDDDLIGGAPQAPPIERLMLPEMLAEGPMLVE